MSIYRAKSLIRQSTPCELSLTVLMSFTIAEQDRKYAYNNEASSCSHICSCKPTTITYCLYML